MHYIPVNEANTQNCILGVFAGSTVPLPLSAVCMLCGTTGIHCVYVMYVWSIYVPDSIACMLYMYGLPESIVWMLYMVIVISRLKLALYFRRLSLTYQCVWPSFLTHSLFFSIISAITKVRCT